MKTLAESIPILEGKSTRFFKKCQFGKEDFPEIKKEQMFWLDVGSLSENSNLLETGYWEVLWWKLMKIHTIKKVSRISSLIFVSITGVQS